MILRRIGIWIARQALTFVLSMAATVSWMVGLHAFIDVEPSLPLVLIVAALSALLPALSALEAAGRRIVSGREYKMDFVSSLVLATVLVALPFSAVYLYFLGECVRCAQTYWDGALAVVAFAIPAALFQAVAYRAGKRLI
jgi:hypothetical protein